MKKNCNPWGGGFAVGRFFPCASVGLFLIKPTVIALTIWISRIRVCFSISFPFSHLGNPSELTELGRWQCLSPLCSFVLGLLYSKSPCDLLSKQCCSSLPKLLASETTVLTKRFLSPFTMVTCLHSAVRYPREKLSINSLLSLWFPEIMWATEKVRNYTFHQTGSRKHCANRNIRSASGWWIIMARNLPLDIKKRQEWWSVKPEST